MTDVVVRAAASSDEAFLRRMVFAAWRWNRPWNETAYLDHDVENGRDSYVDGFGTRKGDIGSVAEVGGELAGAAWVRILAGEESRAGHVDDTVPELVVGVADDLRGRGIGRRVVEVTIAACRARDVAAISLHVADENHRARGMYERLGFVPVRERASGTVMVLGLTPGGG